MKEPLHTPTCKNQLVLVAENIIKAFSELLKNGKGYYRNQEQMARAIELGKFLSSKEEIAAADDVTLFRIKEDISQYEQRYGKKSIYGTAGFCWCKGYL
jgi:hypothetical protein